MRVIRSLLNEKREVEKVKNGMEKKMGIEEENCLLFEELRYLQEKLSVLAESSFEYAASQNWEAQNTGLLVSHNFIIQAKPVWYSF